ncbi:MAG: YihY/virulence factor BrkB family protein, partial [Lachnospiraceae bacterium]|nr:YihY/virulence factor BrkB family protein [Lachnospiraceae bacterium]
TIKKVFFSFLSTCIKIINKFISTSMHVYASNAAFFMIIAAIPTTMLMFSAVSLIPQVDIDAFLDNILILVPNIPYIKSAINKCLSIAEKLATPSLLSINAIFSFGAASGVLHSLSFAIKKTHGYDNRFSFLKLRIHSIFNVLLLLVLIIIIGITFLLGGLVENIIFIYFPFAYDMVEHILSFKYPIATLMLIVFLLLLYSSSTDFKRPIKTNIIGAIIATLLWILTSFGFSIYFTLIPLQSSIYGSLISVVIVMLWLWAVFMIILGGSTINEILFPQNKIKLRDTEKIKKIITETIIEK